MYLLNRVNSINNFNENISQCIFCYFYVDEKYFYFIKLKNYNAYFVIFLNNLLNNTN